jgi:glycine dehydrogenase subunit 1
MRALIYLSCVGKQGLIDVAGLNYEKAEFAKNLLAKIKGVSVKQGSPTFNEFTAVLPKDPVEVIARMIEKGFAPGFSLGRYYRDMKNYMLIAVTEKRTKEEIVKYAETLESVLWS